MANQFRHDLKSWMLKTIATRFAALPLVLLLVVCLFVLAGTVHADIFVSNYYNNSVGKYHDDGTDNILNFLTGAATAEGVQCVKLTSNEVYVANANSPTIRVYNLTTGDHLPSKDFTIAGAIDIVAMAMNANATVLYGADYGSNHIWGCKSSDRVTWRSLHTCQSLQRQYKFVPRRSCRPGWQRLRVK